MVKSENVLIIACIALTIGFLLGVVFTIYRIGPSKGMGNTPQENREMSQTPDSQQLMMEIEQLKGLTEKTPEDPNLWIHLGNLYFDTNQIASAITSYEKSLELSPENADVWTDLGVMYRRNKQPEKAIEAFSKAMDIDPEHEISRLNKGIVLLHDLEDKKGAKEAWNGLLTINPMAKTPNGQPLKQLIDNIDKMNKP